MLMASNLPLSELWYCCVYDAVNIVADPGKILHFTFLVLSVCVATPAVWIKLSANAKTATTLGLLKPGIKTELFSVICILPRTV